MLMINGQVIELRQGGDPKIAHFPLVPDAYPCVLYFGSEEDRDGFTDEVAGLDDGVQIMVPTSSR